MIVAAILSVLVVCFKYLCKRHQRSIGQVVDAEDPNKIIAHPESYQGIYTHFDSSANNSDLPTYSQVVARQEQHSSGGAQSFQLRTINVQQKEQERDEDTYSFI
jgi:hypothetical protein